LVRKLAIAFHFLAFLLAVSVFADEPLRVALPPAPHCDTVDRAASAAAGVCLYLRERLIECPSVRLVSGGRAGAILAELQSGKRTCSPDALLAEFSEYLSVDVLVQCRVEEAILQLDVHLKTGVRRHEIPFPEQVSVQKAVHQAAALLVDDLKLPPRDRKTVTQTRIPDARAFSAYYTSHVLSARRPKSPGQVRLNVLRGVLENNRNSAYLASQILRSADMVLSARKTTEQLAEKAVLMAKLSLKAVLGTPFETAAYPMLRRQPEAFEAELISLSRPLPGELFDDAGDLFDADKGGLEDLEAAPKPEGAGEKLPVEAGAGAIRLLGFIRSQKGFERIGAAAKNENPLVRESAAFALRFYAEEQGMEALRKLAEDKNEAVAFTAAASLRERGAEHPGLLARARKIAVADARHRREATEVVGSFGGQDDIPMLVRLARDPDPAVRREAVKGLLRLSGADDAMLAELLLDTDQNVVVELLAAFPPKAGEGPVGLVTELANDPFGPVAQAARLALSPYRPAGGRDQLLFDLAIEHSYIRMKLINQLAEAGDAQSLEDLVAACSNRHPHARAHALQRLFAQSPERGRAALEAAIGDSYRWVRLHAAALLAKAATDASAPAIRRALKVESDEAVRLYLEDALAKAEGRPMPQPRPAARSAAGEKSLTWLCQNGLDTADSPFDGYYQLTIKVGDTWKKGYAGGKIFFGRASTVVNPGQIVVDPAWGDQFWLVLESQLTGENLPYIDGVVFGEETMNISPNALWPCGWRLFCLDAGIDPTRVNGDMTKLNTYEARAWRHWALERCVDGFNVLYDHMKLRYGKLRPGIQVSTFLPQQGLLSAGSTPADLRWKFDVGGVYHYKGCNRMATYNMIRRYKRLWPERPIIWLSLGIGGYEMNPVRRTQKVPTTPLMTTGRRAWADSVTAYLAGADPGWFSIWIFVEKDWHGTMGSMRGVTVLPEDIFPDSPTLRRAINYGFKGAEQDYEDLKPPSPDDMKLAPADEELDIAEELGLEHKDVKQRKIKEAIEEHKEQFRLGFCLYGEYVYNCVRALSGLPRLNYTPPALVVRPGVSVWTRPATPNPLIPGAALLNSYDFLCDINKVSSFDLSEYRMIVVHDPGPLSDATIEALTEWLRTCPGLLYVHRDLAADNAAEASTPQDHDGVLARDWPWEKEVAIKAAAGKSKFGEQMLNGPGGKLTVKQARIGSTFEVAQGGAEAILSCQGKPCLVLWRAPGRFKGAVVFDGVESASRDYLVALRRELNSVHEEHGVGLALKGPILHQILETDAFVAATCTGYFRNVSETHAYPGVDLMAGRKDPPVGGGRSGTIVARQYVGKYAASMSGVSVLCYRPITKAEKTEGGMLVQSPGLMRAGSALGAVTLRPQTGEPLAQVEEPVQWIVYGEEEGYATFPFRETGSMVTYFRCKRPVIVSPAEP